MKISCSELTEENPSAALELVKYVNPVYFCNYQLHSFQDKYGIRFTAFLSNNTSAEEFYIH